MPWPFVDEKSIVASLDRIVAAIDRLAARFKRPRMPGLLKLQVTSEGKRNMLNFKLTLPPSGALDVVTRELSVSIGGSDPIVTVLPGAALEAGGFSGNDSDSVLVKLVDVDDAGNRSEPREQTFTLTDNLAPPQPGELGLVVESET